MSTKTAKSMPANNSEENPFNRSSMCAHTPPSNKDKEGETTNFITKATDIACNKCEKSDKHTKLKCGTCNRWWHAVCEGMKEIIQTKVNAGKWQCLACTTPLSIIPDANNIDLTRTEILKEPENPKKVIPIASNASQKKVVGAGKSNPPAPLQLKATVQKSLKRTNEIIPDLTQTMDQSKVLQSMQAQSTMKPASSKGHSKVTTSSTRSRLRLLAEEHALKKEEMELTLRLKQLELDKAYLAEQREIIDQSSTTSSSVTSVRMLDDDADVRRASLERCDDWIQCQRNRTARAPVQSTSTMLLKPTTSTNDFLNATLGTSYQPEEFQLSKMQIRARQVVSRELPLFSGDPRDWPLFISAFTESTRQCGFTQAENLAPLSRCLRSLASEAVKADLMNPVSLPTAITTLKMLFGRPEVVFNALVDHTRQAPAVKMEKMETIVIFAMRIKAMCETAKLAGMAGNLSNTALLMEFVDRLPPTLKREWGRYQRGEENAGNTVDLNSFDTWLRQESEYASAVTGKWSTSQRNSQDTLERKPSRKEVFHGAHQAEESELCPAYAPPRTSMKLQNVKCSPKVACLTVG